MLHEQLTENDVKKIKEEIEYRKLTVRKNAIEAVKEARAHGDLSENFEYHAAKKDKERVYIKVNENFGYYAVIRKIENTDDGGDEIRKF